jgi:hypothetical protein
MAGRSSVGLAGLVAGFLTGFAAVLVFHQGMVAVLHGLGMVPNPPFSLNPTRPFGVPQIWSTAFWGGVWGMVLAVVLARSGRLPSWLVGLVFGALAPSLVFWFVVAPLKGLPIASGWNPAAMLRALLINGAWGLGTVLLLPAAARLPGLARAPQ